LFLRFNKNPVPKGAVFCCAGYVSPVALRLPGLRIRTRPARPVARTRCAAPPPGKHPARPPGSLTSAIPITLIGYPVIVLINNMDYLPCVMNQRIISPEGEK